VPSAAPAHGAEDLLMKILVINTGSSSLKCTLFAMPERKALADALVEKIGEGDGVLRMEAAGKAIQRPCRARDHEQALDAVLDGLAHESGVLADPDEIAAVGHRVVHGGEKISHSVAVDQEVIEVIRENFELAPLHNPANLAGLQAAMHRFPGKLQVGVFDTAFHKSMPPEAYLYALPYELYEKRHVRRYGFHGTSHRYVAERAAELLGMAPQDCNLITMHLGNGCSAAAVRGGRSVDTSMGLTPLEGLVMGTRCGDIDPALVFFFIENLGMEPAEVNAMLNRRSGLLGLSGVANDMRTLLEAAAGGNRRADLAIDVFCYRVKKYIGAYMAVLGRVDGLVFTGGIGENGVEVRRRACQGLEGLGIRLDQEMNRAAVGREVIISADDSRTRVLVVPTDEALKIAIDTYEIYTKQSSKQPRKEPA
jgi:acetate kinase